MKEIKAPNKNSTGLYSVFLAGSIEMGAAEEWQSRLARELKEFDVVLLNPRRDDWDSSWKQSVEDKQFLGQVTWEYENLKAAKKIFLYFDPKTKAPISLLELGLFADSKKVVVCCPKDFYRRGNVEFICNEFKIPLYDTLDSAIKQVKKDLLPYGI